MMKEIAPLNIQYVNPCNSLAVFHDKEYKETDVDVEIQMSVQDVYDNTDNVIFKTVQPIMMASATYKGSYELLTEVNEAVATWVADNNYDFNGAMFSIYHVSPAMERNPENWVTEVCFPVKTK